MTRQVAIGAIVAFALTVLGLSLWQPGGDAPATPAPAPQPAGTAAPVVAPPPKDVHASQLGVELRQTTTIGGRLHKQLVFESAVDAGTAPAP